MSASPILLGVTISALLSDLRYWGLALLMVAETVFPPIPSEVVLPLAGYLVQQGDFTFAGALVARHGGLSHRRVGARGGGSPRRPPVRRALTLIGSTVWNALLIGAGYVLGEQWEHVSDAIGRLSTPLLVITALAVAGLVLRRWLGRVPHDEP